MARITVYAVEETATGLLICLLIGGAIGLFRSLFRCPKVAEP